MYAQEATPQVEETVVVKGKALSDANKAKLKLNEVSGATNIISSEDAERRSVRTSQDILAYQPGKLLVRGDTPLFKVERLLGIDLDHIEAETLAGLVYETLKRVPEEEEVLEVEGLRIIIKKMKGPKIILAKVLMLG